jgi:hypothetical protein
VNFLNLIIEQVVASGPGKIRLMIIIFSHARFKLLLCVLVASQAAQRLYQQRVFLCASVDLLSQLSKDWPAGGASLSYTSIRQEMRPNIS